MTSPFKVFRKNQKMALAVLGVLVIVGFVILPNMLQLQSSGGYKNPVVVETSEFGDLKQSDISKLIGRRQVAIRFARNVRSQVVSRGGTGMVASYFLSRIGPEPTEEGVVRGWLLTRQAQQAGVVFSDDAINSFIEQITERKIDNGEIQGMLGNMNVSPGLLFDVLRDELLAREMDFEMRLGLVGTMPGQRWDYFRRLNRFATVEVTPVPVSDYVSKLTQKPDPETLEAFFDEHKNRNPDPDSPEWGFRRPKKVSLRFFRADLEKFTDIDAVTDEEVKKYYEENKELCDQWPEDQLHDTGKLDETKKPDETEKPDETGQPQEKTPGDDAAPPDTSPHPAGESDTGTEPDVEPSDPGEKPDVTPADEKAPEPDDRPGEGDSSATKGASPFRSVSLLQEKAPENEKPENEKADAESADAEQSPSTSEPSETEPNTPAPEGEPEVQPPDAEKIPEPDLPPVEPDLPPVTPDDGKQDEAGKEPEDPFKGRRGEKIREILAGQKAAERVDEIFELLETEMNGYRRSLANYKAKRNAAPPKKLNFKKLADKYGVAEGCLKEKSRLEMEQSAVGTSIIDGKFLVDHVYDTRGGQLYLPTASVGYNARYLSWKETETESRADQQEKKKENRIALSECHGMPEFDEKGVKTRVLAAWKTEQARPLAVKAAEALAEKANKAGQPLAEVFPNHDVKTTDRFTWLTFGNVSADQWRRPPKVSEVEGVDRPGPDFFRKVLELEEGDVGVAMNYPRTVAYVIRVVEVEPSQEELWGKFRSDVTFQQITFPKWGSWQDINEINAALKEELESAAGLKWLRPANRSRNE